MVAPVPDDEDPRVVAVQAEPVSAVVDAVVGRGVQHQVQRAQARHQLRVDPVTNQDCDEDTMFGPLSTKYSLTKSLVKLHKIKSMKEQV